MVKFWIACLISGLEHVHQQGIIHRDVKPENLVIDREGYLRITDFGIARKKNQINIKDNSGTPGYMAPEVMFKLGCTSASDFFAIGVILHECIYGRRPYAGSTRDEIKSDVKQRQINLEKTDIPASWSPHVADLINQVS